MKNNVESYDYQCLNDAREILKSIDMPVKYCNPRCLMVFAACADMGADSVRWRDATEQYHGIHEIIEFINREFPNKAGLDKSNYCENSRETIRKYTLKPFVQAGIMEQKYGLATNDKTNAYRFTARFSFLLRTYGTPQWEDALASFLDGYTTYSEILKQEKKIEAAYKVCYEGSELSFRLNPHNKLQKEIIENLFPLIAKEQLPELLYVGDAVDRDLKQESDRLAELGINVLSDSPILPDIIAYDEKNNRILFIEAYYSGGAFTVDKVNKIKSLCHCKEGTEAAFITAFDTTKKMLKAYQEVAWDTEIWIAEEPTHLVHKNGDKFVGRPL